MNTSIHRTLLKRSRPCLKILDPFPFLPAMAGAEKRAKRQGKNVLSFLGRHSLDSPPTRKARGHRYVEKKYIHPEIKMIRLGTHGVKMWKGLPGLAKEIESLKERQARVQLQVAAFDLDDTIVKTKSGGRFARSGSDWQFIDETKLATKLAEFVAAGAKTGSPSVVAILTNQGGVTNKADSKSLANLAERLDAVLAKLPPAALHVAVYGATKRSKADRGPHLSPEELHKWFRKPEPGMFEQLLADLGVTRDEVDFGHSFYCGDAAGRKTDFSDSDKQFAKNVGLTFYTPEEYFEA